MQATHDGVHAALTLPFDVIYVLVCAYRGFGLALQRRNDAAGEHQCPALRLRGQLKSGLITFY